MLNKIIGKSASKSMPLLSLLPNKGDCRELITYKEDFISRVEEIRSLIENLDYNDEQKQILLAEESLLKQIISWLS